MRIQDTLPILVVLAATLLLVSQTHAQDGKATSPQVRPRLSAEAIATSHPVARDALTQLPPLVNEETYRQLGFDSPDEVKQAQLGAPIHVFMVRLDQLKAYGSRDKPDALLSETNEVLYPVEVSGRIRTGLRMRMVDGAWRLSSFGASAKTQALGAASKRAFALSKVTAGDQVAVDIPALQLHFMGYHDARGNLMLLPAADDTRFKLKAGTAEPAQRVFARLAPFAKRYPEGQRIVD
ncbi:MAG: hypothetical protein HZC22_03485 [Rhodocyclales bacterium]|nr:hypothetical protein [Rhodocyclales bacterium]